MTMDQVSEVVVDVLNELVLLLQGDLGLSACVTQVRHNSAP